MWIVAIYIHGNLLERLCSFLYLYSFITFPNFFWEKIIHVGQCIYEEWWIIFSLDEYLWFQSGRLIMAGHLSFGFIEGLLRDDWEFWTVIQQYNQGMLRKRVRYMNRLTEMYLPLMLRLMDTQRTRIWIPVHPSLTSVLLFGYPEFSSFTQMFLNGGKFSTCVFGLEGNEGYASF